MSSLKYILKPVIALNVAGWRTLVQRLNTEGKEQLKQRFVQHTERVQNTKMFYDYFFW